MSAIDRTNLKSLCETAPDSVMIYNEALLWYLSAKMGREVTESEMGLALHDSGRTPWFNYAGLLSVI